MTDQDDESEQDEQDDESGMTREELEQKVKEHREKRKDAYVKMGTVDKPRE